MGRIQRQRKVCGRLIVTLIKGDFPGFNFASSSLRFAVYKKKKFDNVKLHDKHREEKYTSSFK